MNCNVMNEVIAAFPIETDENGRLTEQIPYGNGHINDTFRLCCKTQDQKEKNFILQRINHDIFKNPSQLMENVVHVTEYLRGIIISQGGDPDRETLNVVKTRDGANFYQD